MRVLYAKLSQPSRMVWSLCLADPALAAVEFVDVDLTKGEQKAPANLALNPAGGVPMLDDNGFGLGESHAICKYLIAAHSGVADHWYPADAQKRAKVDEYLDWHHTHTRKGVPYFFHQYVASAFGMSPDAGRIQSGIEEYTKAIEFLNKHNLAKGPFIAGDEISIADLSAYGELGPMRNDPTFVPIFAANSNVKAWLERMGEQAWHAQVMGPTDAFMAKSNASE